MTDEELLKLDSFDLIKELRPFNHTFTLTLNEESPWIDELLLEIGFEIAKMGIRKGKNGGVLWTLGCGDYYYRIWIYYLDEEHYELRFEYQVEDYDDYRKGLLIPPTQLLEREKVKCQLG